MDDASVVFFGFSRGREEGGGEEKREGEERKEMAGLRDRWDELRTMRIAASWVHELVCQADVQYKSLLQGLVFGKHLGVFIEDETGHGVS
jgi:hypothetical protein